jgi:uncharacterized protein (TIGR01777 family)
MVGKLVGSSSLDKGILMHVLLTGASGFVGRELCRRLLADLHTVTAVSRSPDRCREVLGVEDVVAWADLDAAFLKGIDAVVHLAGESVQGRWNAAKRSQVRTSRIEGTQAIVDAIRRAANKPGVLLSASGIGFYGCGGESTLTEASSAGDDYFAALCLDWEALALGAEACGCRVGLLRFGMILGQGGGAISAMLTPAKWGISGPLGTGKQWWSWVGIDDAVSAIIFSLTTSISGPINIVAPTPIRQSEFQRTLGRVLSRPAFLPAPAFVLRLILGTFAEEVLASKRVVPTALSEAGFTWAVPNLEDALARSV